MKKVIALLTLILNTCSPVAANDYIYGEIKLGTFFDANTQCQTCVYRDGEIPAYISVGRGRKEGNWIVEGEFLHRSNLDRGTPFNNKKEYHRNGVFLKLRYQVPYD